MSMRMGWPGGFEFSWHHSHNPICSMFVIWSLYDTLVIHGDASCSGALLDPAMWRIASDGPISPPCRSPPQSELPVSRAS
jgi:hypothetical protein